ncbi:MAG: helix-turn-helix domain-containing protein [Candidatus Anammoximicrobium sp.]|nr:helix-turn-helix domain-containing protein [Candidatus Anammoximicrobium sp.]
MPTHLSKFFRQRRIALGLRLSDLARRCGYQNLSKGSNRIDRFENTGEIHVLLYPKLADALGIDRETCERLNEEDRQQARREWLEYINTPVEPTLVVRALPGCFIGRDLPEDCTTIDQMEQFASDLARRFHKMVWLVVSRKLTIRFNEDGSKHSVEEATPDHPNAPFMRLKGSKRPFLFGCYGGGGLTLKPLPQAPKVPSDRADNS